MTLVLADMVNICDSLHVSWDTIIQVVPTDVDDRWTNPTATPCHPLIIILLVGLTGKPRNPKTRATFPLRLLRLIHTSHQNPSHHPRQTTQAWMLGTRGVLEVFSWRENNVSGNRNWSGKGWKGSIWGRGKGANKGVRQKLRCATLTHI